MKIGWRSSAPEEVAEIDADGNPVPSTLTPAEDIALGVCDECHGPLTEIWSAGYYRLGGGGAGGGTWPSAEPGESWTFCSKEHMNAFLAKRHTP